MTSALQRAGRGNGGTPALAMVVWSAAAVCLMTVGLCGGVAGATPTGDKIGPHQAFTAAVNGQSGVSQPVVIRMACGGPVKPGQTGHPVAGQTVSVLRATTVSNPVGDTGADSHQIGAFFGAPPPSATSPAAGNLNFQRYGTKTLPVSDLLPCSGSGQVYFVPLPTVPGGQRIVDIPVTYVSLLP